jgi:ribosomal protein L13E
LDAKSGNGLFTVEDQKGMKMPINKPIVKRSIGGIGLVRKGRGFSKSELKESGIDNIKIARKKGIPVDELRKTRIPENIEQLKPIANKILDSKKTVKPRKRTKIKE